MTYFLNRLPIIVFVIPTIVHKKTVAELSRFAQTDNITFITLISRISRISNDIVKLTNRYSILLNHWLNVVTINIKEKSTHFKSTSLLKNQKLLAMSNKLNSARSSKISLIFLDIIKAVTSVSNDNIIARQVTAKNVMEGL